MKILNLYACLGGNRYKWNEVKDDIEVTAVELDEELARLYQERFPNDKVVVSNKTKMKKLKYPDMTLYQEIILLNKLYDGDYCVENVIPYYDCLIPGKQRGRHLYWTNFRLPNVLTERKNPDFTRAKKMIEVMSDYHDYDFRKYKGKQPRAKIAKNLVCYQAGKTILQTLIDTKENKINQIGLFK